MVWSWRIGDRYHLVLLNTDRRFWSVSFDLPAEVSGWLQVQYANGSNMARIWVQNNVTLAVPVSFIQITL